MAAAHKAQPLRTSLAAAHKAQPLETVLAAMELDPLQQISVTDSMEASVETNELQRVASVQHLASKASAVDAKEVQGLASAHQSKDAAVDAVVVQRLASVQQLTSKA